MKLQTLTLVWYGLIEKQANSILKINILFFESNVKNSAETKSFE